MRRCGRGRDPPHGRAWAALEAEPDGSVGFFYIELAPPSEREFKSLIEKGFFGVVCRLLMEGQREVVLSRSIPSTAVDCSQVQT